MRIPTLLLLPAVMACDVVPNESPPCDDLRSTGRVQAEVLMHGVFDEPLPEGVFVAESEWRQYRVEQDLPVLSGIDWDTEVVHVTNVWSRLDCEYLDDTDDELGVVRIDSVNLGLVAPLATSRDSGCHRENRPIPVILAIPADEAGDITETCAFRP